MQVPAEGGRPGWRRAVERAGAGPVEVAALAVLVLGSVAAAGVLWWVGRSRPVDTPSVVIEQASGVDRPTGPGDVAATSRADVAVHVAGAVRAPGVYRLPAGSRVGDAVAAAGGAAPLAVLDALNLARTVADGEQVLVPSQAHGGAAAGDPALVLGGDQADGSAAGAAGGADGRPGGGGGTGAIGPDGVLDLNRATAADLQELPGIGPILAERILSHREAIGGFSAIGQLREVSGIGERRYQDLAERVRV